MHYEKYRHAVIDAQPTAIKMRQQHTLSLDMYEGLEELVPQTHMHLCDGCASHNAVPTTRYYGGGC